MTSTDEEVVQQVKDGRPLAAILKWPVGDFIPARDGRWLLRILCAELRRQDKRLAELTRRSRDG